MENCNNRRSSKKAKHSNNNSPSALKDGECHINDLPCEILLHIFGYLTTDELFASIGQVCIKWRQLSRDSHLRKRLVFSFERKIPRNLELQLLKDSPNLVTLKMVGRTDPADLLREVANSCPKLRDITLSGYIYLGEGIIQDLANNCPEVRTLNLTYAKYFAHTAEIAEFKHLQHLNLANCIFLDDHALIAIAKNCNHLKYLDISNVSNIHDDAVVFFIKKLSKSLQSLFLNGWRLTDDSYSALAACKGLQQIGVSYCYNMTDIGLAGISGLSQLRLVNLTFCGTQVSYQGITKMFSSGHMSNVTHLDLRRWYWFNTYVNEMLLVISRACPLLTIASISMSEYAYVGLSSLITSCHHLKLLDLMQLCQLRGSSVVNEAKKLQHGQLLVIAREDSITRITLESLAKDNPQRQMIHTNGYALDAPRWKLNLLMN